MLNWLKDLFSKEAEKIDFVESELTLAQMKELVDVPQKGYAIAKYPVTQALWESVMGANPSNFQGSTRPVEMVNWFDSLVFCNALSEAEGLRKVYALPSGLKEALAVQTTDQDASMVEWLRDITQDREANGYRLPTDWEWYFAAKANQDFAFVGSDNIDDVGWTHEASKSQTQGVGQKQANDFGLYDMSGNVWEWCWDRWGGGWQDIPTEGSVGPSTGSDHVIRGGSWLDDARIARLSGRGRICPSSRNSYQGLRLCRTIR